MQKLLKAMLLSLLLGVLCSRGALAMENDMLKVGIKYGSDAMFSANLQNYNETVAGQGYAMGYYDDARSFVPLGPATTEYKVTVTVDGNFYASGNTYYEGAGGAETTVGGWHLQLAEDFASYAAAAEAASRYDGAFVAFLTNVYAVRVGQYTSQGRAEEALASWSGADAVKTVGPSGTGVVVTVTGTNRVLFYFDCGGSRSLALLPQPIGTEKPITWFRGYRYYGGFEYRRASGGNMSVINVVNIEDYTKGSVPYEIGNDKPLEAIKAQAVCARTYAARQTRHRSQGFDVCTTDDCQVYQGLAESNETTNRAVDETAGVYMYYNGKLAEAFYYSCNGGASEDAKNVWGEEVAYCKGKQDPYEAYVASRIYKYNWTTTYTKSELTARLRSRGIDVGTISNIYVSEFTPNGNVYAVTIVGSAGTKILRRESCRTTLGLRSMHFRIGDSAGGGVSGGASSSGNSAAYYINNAGGSVTGLKGIYAITGSGTVSELGGSGAYVITSGGVSALRQSSGTSSGTTVTQVTAPPPLTGDTITITGSGWGHNVGMSQWGATAMAELGYDFRAILQFYYTDVTVG